MTSGYSTTAQVRKLGLKAGMRVGFIDPPDAWRLADPPPFTAAGAGPADILIWFVRATAELSAVGMLGERIFPDGALWIAWPRRAAGHDSDVTENGIRDAVLPLGLVDVKVAAIDEDWSGLKVVWRKENRAR